MKTEMKRLGRSLSPPKTTDHGPLTWERPSGWRMADRGWAAGGRLGENARSITGWH
jgi:hypothetical protein